VLDAGGPFEEGTPADRCRIKRMPDQVARQGGFQVLEVRNLRVSRDAPPAAAGDLRGGKGAALPFQC
jgi:hypothetical protein